MSFYERIRQTSAVVIALCLTAVSAFAADLSGICAMHPLSGLTPGESASDWMACAIAEWGVTEGSQDYLSRLETYVKEKYASQGGLDKNKATEWHRIALTVKALGGDPYNFAGVNLIKDGVTEPLVDLKRQGINGLIWAAITAQECGAVFDGELTLEDICSKIVARQNADGGFSLRGESDPDITAMAIRALWNVEGFRPYGELARAALMAMKTPGGGYISYGVENCESSAQAKLAFCYIGDLENAASVDLERYRTGNGYAHVSGGGEDLMATGQALLAEARFSKLEKTAKAEAPTKDTAAIAPVTEKNNAEASAPEPSVKEVQPTVSSATQPKQTMSEQPSPEQTPPEQTQPEQTQPQQSPTEQSPTEQIQSEQAQPEQTQSEQEAKTESKEEKATKAGESEKPDTAGSGESAEESPAAMVISFTAAAALAVAVYLLIKRKNSK